MCGSNCPASVPFLLVPFFDHPQIESALKHLLASTFGTKVVPIIEIPGYGSTSAKLMCEKLKIKSCKEADKLKKAKEEVHPVARSRGSHGGRAVAIGDMYEV